MLHGGWGDLQDGRQRRGGLQLGCERLPVAKRGGVREGGARRAEREAVPVGGDDQPQQCELYGKRKRQPLRYESLLELYLPSDLQAARKLLLAGGS